MFARFQRRLDLALMKTGRRTNIDHVDIRPATDFIETLGNFRDPVFFGDGKCALQANVAKDFDVKELRKFLIAFEMFDADSGADHCDSEGVTHRRKSCEKRKL